MKIVKQIQLKIVIFTAVKIAVYIAWACFRNVKASFISLFFLRDLMKSLS